MILTQIATKLNIMQNAFMKNNKYLKSEMHTEEKKF